MCELTDWHTEQNPEIGKKTQKWKRNATIEHQNFLILWKIKCHADVGVDLMHNIAIFWNTRL